MAVLFYIPQIEKPKPYISLTDRRCFYVNSLSKELTCNDNFRGRISTSWVTLGKIKEED